MKHSGDLRRTDSLPMKDLPRILPTRRTPYEPFHADQKRLGFELLDFWRWSASDLVSNATRGVLAEFLVAQALGLRGNSVRQEWDAYDLETADGIKVEVKSAAFLQSWRQKEFSKIQFSVRTTRHWDAETNHLEAAAKRHADIYVLAFLSHQDQETLDPLNVSQWEFFVLTRQFLDRRTRSQHSITLPTLRKLGIPAHRYEELGQAIRQAAESERPGERAPR